MCYSFNLDFYWQLEYTVESSHDCDANLYYKLVLVEVACKSWCIRQKMTEETKLVQNLVLYCLL